MRFGAAFSSVLAEENWGKRSGKLHQVEGLIKAHAAAMQGNRVKKFVTKG